MAIKYLTLEEARKIVRRAVDKTEDFGHAGSFVAVDRSGVLITASRMDGARVVSYRISRAKAYLTAIQQYDTGTMYDFAMAGPKILVDQMRHFLREPIFNGQGGQLIYRDGESVGAISTGMGIPPMVQLPGVDPTKLIMDGKPANGEDLVMSYALSKPYDPQHGDDAVKWERAYGALPTEEGSGRQDPPPASRQHDLDRALRLSDAAMAEARQRNADVAVAILDRSGEVVQVDRMDDAAPMTPDAAIALALTAVNFGGPSETAAQHADISGLSSATRLKLVAAPGGLVFKHDGKIHGAIGISGADAETCVAIAKAALKAL